MVLDYVKNPLSNFVFCCVPIVEMKCKIELELEETNNCIMERLSVKIINCMYLPAYALAVPTNYDLPP